MTDDDIALAEVRPLLMGKPIKQIEPNLSIGLWLFVRRMRLCGG